MPMRRAAVCLIRMYQKFLSPLKGKSTCRFFPTCSQYAVRVYCDFGLIRGTVMTAWRLLRCQPFYHGGYVDMPPPHKHHPDRIPRSAVCPAPRYGQWLVQTSHIHPNS